MMIVAVTLRLHHMLQASIPFEQRYFVTSQVPSELSQIVSGAESVDF